MKTTISKDHLGKFLDTMGYLPARGLTARHGIAAANIGNRWQRSPFYPAQLPQPGRTAARLGKSFRRLNKRTAPLMGPGLGIG